MARKNQKSQANANAQAKADNEALLRARAKQNAKKALEAEAAAKSKAEDDSKAKDQEAEDARAEQKAEAKRSKAKNLATHRRQLQSQLSVHDAFTRALSVAALAGGGYLLGMLLMPLYHSSLFTIAKSFVFGSSTAPGIPVALAQGLLPAAMAPFAPFVAIGVPALLMLYAMAYQYNASKYMSVPRQRRKPSTAPQEVDAAPNQTAPENNVKPVVEPEKTPAKKQQQGSRKAVVPGLQKTRSQAKVVNAPAAEAENTAAPKRKTAHRR